MNQQIERIPGTVIVGTIAASTVALSALNFPYATLGIGLGCAAMALADRCCRKSKPNVEGLNFTAYLLPRGLKSEIGEIVGRLDGYFPGIIYDRWSGRRGEICFEHVSTPTDPIGLYKPAVNLTHKGYEVVEEPEAGDLIFYFNTKTREGSNLCEHVGRVSSVVNGVVWVESKWGKMRVMEHLEEAVPAMYGDAVFYMRKKPEPSVKDS